MPGQLSRCVEALQIGFGREDWLGQQCLRASARNRHCCRRLRLTSVLVDRATKNRVWRSCVRPSEMYPGPLQYIENIAAAVNKCPDTGGFKRFTAFAR